MRISGGISFRRSMEKMAMKKRDILLMFFCLSSALAQAEDGITIDLPMAGWRYSEGQKLQFSQQVNYPASSVNTPENQSAAAMIAGHVAEQVKSSNPFTLIVNGVPMPMRVEEDAFSRPYIFGPGSNNVEVRSPDGKAVARTQFYEAYPGVTPPRLRVLLSWDTDGTDLDLHVVTPDGEHCFYANRVLANGGALDVDVTSGYGPEIFGTPAPLPGTYLVFLNYYGSGSEGDITVAQVTIITNENTLDEKKQTFIVPMRSPGELTLVSAFVYP